MSGRKEKKRAGRILSKAEDVTLLAFTCVAHILRKTVAGATSLEKVEHSSQSVGCPWDDRGPSTVEITKALKGQCDGLRGL